MHSIDVMKKSWSKLNHIIVLVAGLALVLLPARNYAQTPESSSGLQVSPTRSELTVNTGKSDSTVLSIKNITGGLITVRAEIDDFTPDDTGTPRLLTNQTEPAATSIKPFLVPIHEFSLKIGETKKLQLTLRVPQDQPAGGYYGVVRFKAFPQNNSAGGNGQQVSLTASVGHIILVQVPGQITEKLEAVSLSAEYHRNPSNFFVHRPDSMRLEIKNTGNTFIKPFGNVSVKNSQGHEVYNYEINATDPRGNVLPKSSRVFHDTVKNLSSFGHYSAVASVSYGNGGDVLTLKTSFWIVPLWLLIAVGCALLLGVVLIYLLYRRLLRHHRRFHRR